LVLNSDYTFQRAVEALGTGSADAVAFGRPFIANPDLPYRLREKLALAVPNRETFYSQGSQGYTDYENAA
jgi:2,4-dienoyl-CoA reductase-like NADH-dependent reductase (Old Yellow Enzyme family)